MAGSIGRRKPLRRTRATPPSERHHLNRPNATSIVTWPTSKPRAHEGLRKVCSSRNRQLTVHLYMNTRDRSKAFCKYEWASSTKNERASTIWVKARTSRWRTVAAKPWCLKRTTRIPGRYNNADIFTDNAKLVSVHQLHSNISRSTSNRPKNQDAQIIRGFLKRQYSGRDENR